MKNPETIKEGMIYRVYEKSIDKNIDKEWEVISVVLSLDIEQDKSVYTLEDLKMIKDTEAGLDKTWTYNPSEKGWDEVIFEEIGNKEDHPEYFL